MPIASLVLLLAACGEPAPPSPAPPSAAPAVEASVAPAVATPAAETVHVASPYARAMPPGSPASAVFLTLHNGGGSDTALVAARSDAADSVELHTHVEADGMMQMRQVDRVALPAGQQVVLQPGGDHVMLIGLRQDLAPGAELALTLVYADGSELALTVPVLEIMPGMQGGPASQGMDHAGHGSGG